MSQIASYNDTSSSDSLTRGSARSMRNLALAALLFNVLSALLFIFTVNRAVYDEPYMMRDVARYATQGATTNSIRAHVNAMGPTSLLWVAEVVRFFPGHDQLRIARLAVLLSWVLLSIAVFSFAPNTETPAVWYAALLFTFIFPHTMTAMSTVLTEGPAILFALAGSMLWLHGATKINISFASAACMLAGGCLLGVAITCRQYFLAAAGAAGVVAVILFLERRSEKLALSAWALSIASSFLLAMVPVAGLYRVWGGLSSPAMSEGLSYGVTSHVGLNFLRPVVATLCIAIYLLLLSFPAALLTGLARSWRALTFSAIAGLGAALAMPRILEPGPIHSFIELAGGVPAGRRAIFGLLSALAILNGAGFLSRSSEMRSDIRNCKPVLFSGLAVVLFVVEQSAIGGDVPFYDRYVLQVAPFLGAVIFFVFPRLTATRRLALAFSWLVSQFMLWRYLWTAASS